MRLPRRIHEKSENDFPVPGPGVRMKERLSATLDAFNGNRMSWPLPFRRGTGRSLKCQRRPLLAESHSLNYFI
jgi:hypothetical protein